MQQSKEFELDESFRFMVAMVSKSYPQLRKIVGGLGRSEVLEKGATIEDLRLKHTWQDQRIPTRWVPTIGMWGGVCSPSELIVASGSNHNNLRVFKDRHGVVGGARTGKGVEQWKLAHTVFSLFYTHPRFTKSDGLTKENIGWLTGHFGILGIEAKLYVERMTSLVIDDLDAKENAYDLTAKELQEPWDSIYYVRPLPEYSLYSEP